MAGPRGVGRAIFASVLLTVGGVLNVIYGIAAIGNSDFFLNNTQFIFSNLKFWGWITLLLGLLQLAAAASLAGGGAFGRWIGIIAASLSAIGALLALPAYPFWSLAIFALDLYIIHGLAIFGEDERADARTVRS